MGCASCLLAALTFATTGLASDLSVRGPEACPDATELAFRVERALGVPLTESGSLRFGVVFATERAPAPGYAARLHVQRAGATSSSTERVIRAHDCGRLGDAVGLAIALAIGAEQPSPPASPGASDSAPPARFSSTATQASVSREASVARDHEVVAAGDVHWLPVVQGFLLADGGSLGSPGLGVGLGTELRGARLALRAQGALLFERHIASAAGEGAAALSLMLGSLSGCVAPLGSLHSSFAAFTCAGWELGRLQGEGEGVAQPRQGQQLWTAPRVDAGLTGAFPGSALRLALQLSVAAPLERDDFCLREQGCVYRAPGAVGRLSLGVELGFE